MKCPIDQTEMEKGHLKYGTVWTAGKPIDQTNLFGLLNRVKGIKTVYAYKCPKCGKVELKEEENN